MDKELEKVYLTVDDLERFYSIKKSQQAQFRMKKLIPYVRPAGSKVCLYKREDIEEWLRTWQVC